jgi:hypothetical protein
MHRILFLPDIRLAGYPANPKSGYRISGKGRIPVPDIRPDTWLDNYMSGKISNKFIKTALIFIDFCKHETKHDLVTKLIFVDIFFLA